MAWFGFEIASAKQLHDLPKVVDLSGGNRVSLSEPNRSLLHRPVKRQVNMRGESQIGQLSTLGDRMTILGARNASRI